MTCDNCDPKKLYPGMIIRVTNDLHSCAVCGSELPNHILHPIKDETNLPTIEYKLLSSDTDDIQKILNQWKHMYTIKTLHMTSSNGETTLLLTRVRKD